jgi:hypothetical protein
MTQSYCIQFNKITNVKQSFVLNSIVISNVRHFKLQYGYAFCILWRQMVVLVYTQTIELDINMLGLISSYDYEFEKTQIHLNWNQR